MKGNATRGSLFKKYAAVLILLVGGVLLLSSLVNLYFSYQETKKALIRLERQQAQSAATRIEQFVTGIERQVRAAMEVPFTDAAAAREQREIDFLRLLRDVPAITEIVQLDADGRLQLLVSRFAPNEMGTQRNLAQDPRFLKTRIGRTYFGPVYFRNESEPYLTIAVPWGEGAPEVAAAEVNLKAVRDVISQIHVGTTGYAYVIDQRGLLVAHPDMSLVLQKRDLSQLPQIQATRAPSRSPDVVTETAGLRGGRVVTSHASIEPLGWLVLAEQPLAEAFAPLQGQIVLSSIFLATGLGLSVLASVMLARRMVAPIRLLQQGAARIGAGELGHRLDVRTGDELEALGTEFNRTAARLEESYATLEQKVETRTRELADANAELSESLEQQTATGEILRVISRSQTDVQPVFDTIARKAFDLCRAKTGAVYTFDGELVHIGAGHSLSPEADEAVQRTYPMPPSRGGATARAILSRAIVYIADIREDREYRLQPLAKVLGYVSILAVPMLHEGRPIGAITVTGAEVNAFSQRQIELLKTFADQAVIAIENVRLFTELQEKNRALTTAHAQVTEALDQQTATSEILRVISRSPTDVQPVFDAIVRSAGRLCEATLSFVTIFVNGQLTVGSAHGVDPEGIAALRRTFPRPAARETAIGRAVLDGRLVHLADAKADPAYTYPGREALGIRSILAVPLLREGIPVGAIAVWRNEVKPFTDKQIELLRTFADQAVIAIENVRLFQELETRTRELGRSVEELQALGEVSRAVSSTLDLETVLTTIVARAAQLASAYGGLIYEYDEASQEFNRISGAHRLDDELGAVLRARPMRLGEGATGRAAVRRAPVQVPDVLAEGAYDVRRIRSIFERRGYRALLAVPLLLEQRILGVLVVWRQEPGTFAAEVVNLLQTFASQSVLAIRNAQLYRELEEKGRQLETASRHKSEFLANMSHELRTPLNAILGFNEMILGQIYGDVPASMKEPLTDIQNSGRHLLRLINNVLDLSKIEAGRMELSLADYSVQDVVERVRASLHPLAVDNELEFTATVPDDLPTAHGDGGRITQCLMNLAGNALKFTRQGRVGISVDLQGDLLVYRVSDTGIGIPKDKIESLFTEFRQGDATIASEFGGTGLGLSITKKFVEMHRGRIWVESEAGKGSTFSFSVPLRLDGGKAA